MNPTSSTRQAMPDPHRMRGRLMIAVSVALAIVLSAYGLWWLIFARHVESTDDAYVAGNLVQVTSQVSGTVLSIAADDTELVRAGMPLIELDRADAEVALGQAEAELARTVREVRALFVNNGTLAANVKLRGVEVERARADLARRQELIASGAVSKEDLEHARHALQRAESALQEARGQHSANRALTDRTSVARHPNVQRAAGQVRARYLAYARTSLPAPVMGYVAKRSVQVGQHIAAGTPLMSIVPLNAVWVDANFKEDQLARMRIGQPVTLQSDLYGSSVVYHGKVSGLAAGTGAAFSLLPPQNATGNWVKIVQRIPVRIALDQLELQARPLRIGLSMRVKVDISRDAGASLAAGGPARSAPAYKTTVFDAAGQEADALVARIVAENAGRAGADL
ncbi:MAG TPA: HlyD family efflux transporter periplasmic adaptor subunit [Paucimonas sp.]|nr:HlyD family efflux transporter periplasmic adaptor subunit [Paucimonas sp.]